MNRLVSRSFLVLLSASVIITSGCNTTQQQSQTPAGQAGNNGITAKGTGNGNQISMLNTTQEATGGEAKINIVDFDGKFYIPGNDLAKVLDFNTSWEPESQTFKMGDNDATYEWKPDAMEVSKEEETVKLSEAGILRNSLFYIPVSALSILQDDMNYSVTEKELVIFPSAEMVMDPIDGPEEQNTGSELDFEDDPDDPFKGEDTEDTGDAGAPASNEASASINTSNESMMTANWYHEEADGEAVPAALRNIDMNALIRKGKQYLGVDYLFGAAPYPKSSRFDCSTFTQYLFKRQGITLRRLSRAQSKQGVAVSRKKLRKGDLMFFYVPGRFRTNKTVGHVGIYMGNNRMIHSSPKPKNGVQITNINKPYWKKTFLKAKRVAY